MYYSETDKTPEQLKLEIFKAKLDLLIMRLEKLLDT